MRSLTFLAALLVLVGCGGDEPSRGDPFSVTMTDGAASAAREVGVDLGRLIDESAGRAFELLPHQGQMRIEVALEARYSIPEVGVGGFTNPSTGDVSLSIDPTPPGGLKAALETWVPALLAHELHHSSRIRTGPGYGTTLGEALVKEGLADHFVAEAFPDTPRQPWDNALSKTQETDLWRRARPILSTRSGYNHQAWFFGGDGIPRWGGYTLGYKIVQAYLGNSRTASDAVGVPAAEVLKSYESKRRRR